MQSHLGWEEGKRNKQEQDSEHGGGGKGGGGQGVENNQEGGQGVDFTSAEALEALKTGQ